jgi:fluoroquinolone transport system permease protein
MRLLFALINDVRFQVKYGFYFLYAFFSGIYVAILFAIPPEYKTIAASIIILSDPAMLGSFFIGGIWLLEKGEGLHNYWGISPLRPVEYIMSKAISLAFISAVAAILIAAIGLGGGVDFLLLAVSVFIGSMAFTLIGLITATYSRSVNQYLTLITPVQIVLTTPPILSVFGIQHPVLELSPGTALLRFIHASVGGPGGTGMLPAVVLFLWLGLAFFCANKRIPSAMQS